LEVKTLKPKKNKFRAIGGHTCSKQVYYRLQQNRYFITRISPGAVGAGRNDSKENMPRPICMLIPPRISQQTPASSCVSFSRG